MGDNSKYMAFKEVGGRARDRSFVACNLRTVPFHFSNSIEHLYSLINPGKKGLHKCTHDILTVRFEVSQLEDQLSEKWDNA